MDVATVKGNRRRKLREGEEVIFLDASLTYHRLEREVIGLPS